MYSLNVCVDVNKFLKREDVVTHSCVIPSTLQWMYFFDVYTRDLTLHHAAARYNILQNTAAHCNILQHTLARCCTLQQAAAHCHTLQMIHVFAYAPLVRVERTSQMWPRSTCLFVIGKHLETGNTLIELQCVAVYCNVLQCVAVRCSAWQCVAVRCSALQCVAVRCSALQCVAVRCSALQRVAVWNCGSTSIDWFINIH